MKDLKASLTIARLELENGDHFSSEYILHAGAEIIQWGQRFFVVTERFHARADGLMSPIYREARVTLPLQGGHPTLNPEISAL